MIEGEVPPPKGGAEPAPAAPATPAAPAKGANPLLLVGGGAIGAAAIATAAYFIFKK